MIQAEVEGVGVFEFPDGTDPQVIQDTIKKKLGIIDPVQTATQPIEQPRTVLGAPATRMQEEAAALDVSRETRATQELPEVGFSGLLSDADVGTIAKVSPALLTATNPREFGQILTANFPEIGIIEDEQGNLIAANNKTGVQAVINKPGASLMDLMQTIGIGAAFTPAAGLTGAATSVLPKAAIGATGAGLTQGAIEGIQQAVGGELNPEEMAIATTLGGFAEVVVPTVNALRQARQSREVAEAVKAGEDVASQVRTGREASEATGVPLFQAQQTTVPAQLEKQAFLTQLPAGTQKASKELAKQNQAASNAVDEFLSSIAPEQSVISGPEKFRTVAERAVSVRKRARNEISSPIYKQAFRRQRQGKVGLIDTSKLETKIEQMAKQFSPGDEIEKSLANALTKIRGAKGDLRKLHIRKTEIDQVINKFGDNSVGNTTKRFLTDVKNDLVDNLVEQSPSYRAARDEFIRLSPPVDELVNNSMIGKIAEFDDTRLKDISKRIFDPAETNPTVVAKTKEIINDINPDAWNELLRSEIERRMGSIRSTLETGTTENVPAQIFNSLFGNTKQRRVLFSAVDGDAKKNLKFLETALSRARLGRGAGSQTAAREEIKRELRGGIGGAIRTFFGQPIQALGATGAAAVTGATADAAFNARVRALADVMFDPQWKPKIAELRKLSPNSPAAARAMTQLLDDAIATDIQNLQEPEQ